MFSKRKCLYLNSDTNTIANVKKTSTSNNVFGTEIWQLLQKLPLGDIFEYRSSVT